MKTFLKTGVLLVSLGALASSPEPALYQYWFDYDEPSRTGNTRVYDSSSNTLTIDASGLSEGGHALRYRMADKDKRWGSILSRYFVVHSTRKVPDDPGGAVKPVKYQYWFDTDVASRIANTHVYDGNSNPLSIDASSLSEGGHAVNYRMSNSEGQWGTILKRYFVVPSAKTPFDDNPVGAVTPAKYQYWFDTDVASGIANTHTYDGNSNPLTIDASALSEGGHAVNYRMSNSEGQWGSVLKRYFVVSSDSQIDPKEATEPVMMQYWFDNDGDSRVKNTQAYNGQKESFEIDAASLSEGGHALKFRMANKYNQWGSVMSRYFTVPSSPDMSTSKAIAYRIWTNDEVVASGKVPENSEFSLTVDIPENPKLSSVDSRDFSYLTGEKTVTMAASGSFTCAFQMLSESNEWGVPIFSEFDHSVTSKLPTDSIAVPCDYTFKMPDNNNFKAYRFVCDNNSVLYFKASQDCTLDLFHIDSSSDSNLEAQKTLSLKKDEVTKYEGSDIDELPLVAILYGFSNDAANMEDDVFLRIMYENNRLPKPVIKFDPQTWEVSMSCADRRAKIHYTLDGNIPTHESPVYSDVPVKLEKYTKVKAIAAYGDLYDSWVAEATFDGQNMRVPTPELKFAGGEEANEFILTNNLEGVTTYYLIGKGDIHDEAHRKTFDGNPFVIEDGATLKAYSTKEMLTDSEVLSMTVRHSDYATTAPRLRYADGYVIAEHADEDASIWFTDENGQSLQTDPDDPRRVRVEYNSTVKAYAKSTGFAESKAQRLDHTEPPIISVDLFTVTINAKSGQSVVYTTDGTQPNEASIKYEAPFVVAESCTVRAVAFEDELIPAEAEPYSVGYVKCEKPEVSAYDGRYLTLAAESGTVIRYAIGEDTADLREGQAYIDKIDVMGLNQIRAIAQRAGADDSEILTFTPEFYANETDVFTTNPSNLKDAFAWCADKSVLTSVNVNGPLVGTSNEDSGDYAFLRSLPDLQHLNLRNVTDPYIPDGALDAVNLKSIVLPGQLTAVGSKIFGEANTTLCALEIPMEGIVPENLLMGIENSNILIYVRSANNASKAVGMTNGIVKNVVVLGTSDGNNRSENVILHHGRPFYAPKAFDAQKISFTRAFTKDTQLEGFGSGWETMSVPFNVQTIECAGRVLRPFGDVDTGKGECPFWLFSAKDTEWHAETSIFANTPYLIAMPNHPYYADEFVVKGDVVFSSNVVTVPVTPSEQDMTYSFRAGLYIAGNYNWISKDEGMLAINESVATYQNQDFLPGGIFISNERNIPPFEAYVIGNGAKAMPVFDGSAVDELLDDYGTHVWGEAYSICIRSSIPMKLRIYDMVGQLIRIVDVKAGESLRIENLTPGIYFVGNTKVLVKG